MVGVKTKDAVKNKSSDGDLFPRGAAPSATPRVRKRDGQVLFAPPSKRTRPTRPDIDDGAEGPDLSTDLRVTLHGAALSASRLSPGMTSLALVIRADRIAVNVVLPSGIHASAPPDEILVQPEVAPRNFVRKEDDSDGSELESDAESEDSDDEDAVCPLWQTVYVGQVVRVAVLSVEQNDHGRRMVKVSFKPDLVNVGLNPAHVLRRGFPIYAVVRSVEDHGYVLSFGAHIPTTGFLPFDKWRPHEDGEDEVDDEGRLATGHPVEVVVDQDVPVPSKKGAKKFVGVARVSAIRDKVIAATVDVTEQLNYHELRAGMLISARIVKEGPGGVALNAFGVFTIAVDASHVPRLEDGTWDVKVGKQVMTRILYVDAAQKRIGASLLDCFVANMAPRNVPANWKIGTVMKRLKVEQVKPGFALIMTWVAPDKDKSKDGESDKMADYEDEDAARPGEDHAELQVPVFAHISRVSDTKDVKLESKYHKDMIVTDGARIVSVSRFDGLVNVDLRPSILARKALSLDEIEVGSLYDCKVVSHTTLGSVSVAVDGDPHLPGIVPYVHVSDVLISQKRLAQRENLRIGATLRCRALFVNLRKGKVILSAKKSMVSPKYPLLTSLEEADSSLRIANSRSSGDAGDTAEPSSAVFSGSVSKVLENGNVVVSFCGQVAGLVPRTELCLENREDTAQTQSEVESLYPIGQTVHVRLTKVESKLRRLWLSMNLQIKKLSRKGSALKLGQFVDGVITKVDEVAKHFVVSVVVKQPLKGEADLETDLKATEASGEETSIDCHLPFGHIGDTHGMNERLVSEISKRLDVASEKPSSTSVSLEGLMVLSVREQTTVLTLKQSLKDSATAKCLPERFSEVLKLVKKAESDGQDRVLLAGYVKALLPTGVIVGFLGDAVGFARKSRIADHFVSDPGRALKIHQSVTAVVDSIDEDSQRFLLSLRLSDVGNGGHSSHTMSLFASFQNWEKALQKPLIESTFSIGSLVDAAVGTVHPYGVTFKLKSPKGDAVGVALDVNEPNPAVLGNEASSLAKEVQSSRKRKTRKSSNKNEAGDELSKLEKVRVLDVDPFTGVVDVSRDATVIAGGVKKSILNVGSVFNATVLLVKSSYIILAVARSKTRSAIAFALGPPVSDNLAIRPGTSVQCTVLDKSKAQTRRNLVVIDWQSFRSSTLKKVQSIGKDDKRSDYSTTISLLRDSGGQDESLVIGKKIAAKVTRRFPLHVFVGIAQGIVGQIHATNVAYLSDEERAQIPLGPVPAEMESRFELPDQGSKVGPAYIAGIRCTSETQESAPLIVELALAEKRVFLGELSEGQKFLGFIKNVSSRVAKSSEGGGTEKSYSYTRVAIGPSTVVTCTDVNCLFPNEGVELKIGRPVMCLITDVHKGDNGRLFGTLSENGRNSDDFFAGIVQAVDIGHGLKVEIPWHARDSDSKMKSWAHVSLCDIADDFDDVSPTLEGLHKGDIVRVRKLKGVKNPASAENGTWLSMRNGDDGGRDPVLTPEGATSLKAGAKVRGFVSAINKKGCFVTIGREVTAHVLLCDLSDDFVTEPEKVFPVGKVVEGVINETKKHDGGARISLILRKRPRKALKEAPKTGDLKEGSKVIGTVKRVEVYGALLELSKGLTALLHKSEADQDRFIKNPAEEWTVGQKLTAIVIKIDGKGVKVGTKRCYFEAAGLNESQIVEISNSNESSKITEPQGQRRESSEVLENEEDSDAEMESDRDEDDNNDDVAMEDAESALEFEDTDDVVGSGKARDREKHVAPLNIGQSFNFVELDKTQMPGDAEEESGREENEDGDHSKDQEAATKRTSRDKREKKRLKEAAEKAIRLREEALAKNPDSPETAEDFERLLIGEPHCSVLWIRYMAFCLSLHQVDKARSIGERALETISLNEEADRTNVWIAYLNLEAQYGASNAVIGGVGDNLGFQRDAAVFRVFDRACERVTDVEDFHLQAASALRSTNSRIADEILRRATRRFKRSKSVWIASGRAQFKDGDKKSARRSLEKALVSLDKREHVAVISKFAQLEYKFGTPERGRTVFESLAGNFPKRLDLWNIYLDMEVGQCRKAEEDKKEQAVESTRNLFERCTTLNLSSKKMKFVFQKWLAFEKVFGSKEQRAEVKNKAREYVERSVSAKE